MNKRDFPKIHFYDQDFVDIYDRTWAWVQDSWYPRESEIDDNSYFIYTKSEENYIDQLSSVFSSFFLVYSNRNFPAHHGLDYFYSKQEPSGAIRALYDLETGLPVPLENNPEIQKIISAAAAFDGAFLSASPAQRLPPLQFHAYEIPGAQVAVFRCLFERMLDFGRRGE